MNGFVGSQAYENTYQIEPLEHQRFQPSVVRKLCEEIITSNLDGMEYDHSKAKEQAKDLANQIKRAVVLNNMDPRYPSYKIAVQTVIGEIEGQGIRVASKCLWDDQNDNFTSFNYRNKSLFCTGIVFGVYFE